MGESKAGTDLTWSESTDRLAYHNRPLIREVVSVTEEVWLLKWPDSLGHLWWVTARAEGLSPLSGPWSCMADAMAHGRRMVRQIDLLREVTLCGAELDDERMKYTTIQMSRELMEQIREEL